MKSFPVFSASLILLGLSLIAADFAQAESALCSQKRKQYGKSFIKCETVAWDENPISADYQADNVRPMTARPEQIKNPKTGEQTYVNDYAEIAGMSRNFNHAFSKDHPDDKGLPLASRVISAFANKEGPDSAIVNYLMGPWYDGLDKPGKESWTGKCAIWSGWNSDPAVQKILNPIQHGLMCYGIPFTRGELKEIFTALRPNPMYSNDYKVIFDGFYPGYTYMDGRRLEDANIAISEAGLMGTGRIQPGQVIDFMDGAKKHDLHVMMNKDAGAEIWNQTIKNVTDVTYDDGSIEDAYKIVQISELTPTGEDMDNYRLYDQLSALDRSFALSLIRENRVSDSDLCEARKMLGKGCDGIEDLSLSGQVRLFNQMKTSAIKSGKFSFKQVLEVIKHEILIEYAEENDFASNKADHTKVQSYLYSSVHAKEGNKIVEPELRSQWTPPTRKMSDICKDKNFGQREITSLVKRVDPVKACAEIAAGGKDFDIFVGGVPPGDFQGFYAEALFLPGQEEQQKAYNKFLEFLAGCENFDKAVDFMAKLNKMVLNNITDADIQALAKEYPGVKKMIDQPFLSDYFAKKKTIPGAVKLQQKLSTL